MVLTGAGRAGQTGEIIAREFARHGAVPILVDRSASVVDERVADLVKEGYEAHGFAYDLTSESEVSELAARVSELCGDQGLAALVNGAGGFAMSGNVADSTIDVWRLQLAINLTTCFFTTRALLPLLRKGRGAIVSFATGAALPGQNAARMSAYVAAKSGVAVLMRAVAQEETESGVRANAIAPNAIRTAANIDSMGSGVRYVEREEVAETILFLCSPAAKAISGEVIRLV
jgi:NAD(P)-dependent dehydrogenase (short-subunit alcohol dehydrogenase family)